MLDEMFEAELDDFQDDEVDEYDYEIPPECVLCFEDCKKCETHKYKINPKAVRR